MNAVSQFSQDCAEIAEGGLLRRTIYTLSTDCRAIFANIRRPLIKMSDWREKAHENRSANRHFHGAPDSGYAHGWSFLGSPDGVGSSLMRLVRSASATPAAVIAAAVAINPGGFQFGIG